MESLTPIIKSKVGTIYVITFNPLPVIDIIPSIQIAVISTVTKGKTTNTQLRNNSASEITSIRATGGINFILSCIM